MHPQITSCAIDLIRSTSQIHIDPPTCDVISAANAVTRNYVPTFFHPLNVTGAMPTPDTTNSMTIDKALEAKILRFFHLEGWGYIV